MFELNKNKTRAIIPINDFANMCGCFFNVNFTHPDKSNINNGYNCNHPNQEEKDEDIGKCYAWSCPLGWEADEEDCEEFGYDYEEGEYIVTESQDIISKLCKHN